ACCVYRMARKCCLNTQLWATPRGLLFLRQLVLKRCLVVEAGSVMKQRAAYGRMILFVLIKVPFAPCTDTKAHTIIRSRGSSEVVTKLVLMPGAKGSESYPSTRMECA